MAQRVPLKVQRSQGQVVGGTEADRRISQAGLVRTLGGETVSKEVVKKLKTPLRRASFSLSRKEGLAREATKKGEEKVKGRAVPSFKKGKLRGVHSDKR